MEETVFSNLFKLDVNEHTEKKQNLTYLSWSWAWATVKSRYPNANYEIVKFNGLPYVFDENTGYMVYTKVTIEDVTHEMWLPVMDNNNNAMLSHPYEYETKYGKKKVAACTMFEVNKAIMRCLVKNLAMFGLGLYIYAGEDLPSDTAELTEVLTWKDKLSKLFEKNKSTLESVADLIDAALSSGVEEDCHKMYDRTVTYLEKVNS